MRIIIAGSRDFNDFSFVESHCIATIKEWHPDFKTKPVIVSGKQRGVDSLGEKFAIKYGFKIDPYPYIKELGKAGGPKRNTQMANNADCLIAFPYSNSKGTKDMIKQASEKGLMIKIINLP